MEFVLLLIRGSIEPPRPSSNATAAVDAVRESFVGFLTGPSIKAEPLRAWDAGARSGAAAGRIVGSAAYGGLSQAVHNYAVTIRNKDDLTLGWRLEAADGTVLVEKREKKNARSDAEDLLTPLVQQAAEQIVAATKR